MGDSMGWLCFIALLAWLSLVTANDKKIYLVNMKPDLKPASFKTHGDWYASRLQSLTSSNYSLLYTYDTAYHGFAAVLDAVQADSLRGSEGVVDVYEDTIYHPLTTHTPQFLGLDDNVFKSWRTKKGDASVDLNRASQDVIIGLLDTGVWPESKSFDDSGMGPIPAGWRGGCDSAPDFSPKACNKKLIGARVYSKGYDSINSASNNNTSTPRDHEGHGTHTSSTAAGSPVAGASFLGYANGTARGMAPGARIAMYKVCSTDGCYGADILAGIEQAIYDGVHVLSLSLGGSIQEFYSDPIVVGAFAADAKGILVSCAAGNDGPDAGTVVNAAPWIITVAAGSVDRSFPAYVRLGDGRQFSGVSFSSGAGMGTEPVPVIYAVGRNSSSNLCVPGTLDPESVRGKVVLCDRGEFARPEKGLVVRDAGGVGMILANTAEDGESLLPDAHLLPAVAVGEADGNKIRAYVKSDPNATAFLIFGGTVLGAKPAPKVAEFSSRGPNTFSPKLLKPDVTGPGSYILAAWAEDVGPTDLAVDKRKIQYNLDSGTSMACPHISGVAALLKAAHPDWSPSAIRSALMTTASMLDNTKSPLHDDGTGLAATPFAVGSGHINPPQAFSPGLVYDANTDDYIAFLCSHNYTELQVATIAKRHVNCALRKYADPGELNYPSFSVVFKGVNGTAHYSRVVTNVGAATSDYRVVVKAPSSVTVQVNPETLSFRSVGEKKTYGVTFTVNRGLNETIKSPAFGSISWVNQQHYVTSPVAFTWEQLSS